MDITRQIADDIGLTFKLTNCAMLTVDCQNRYRCLAIAYRYLGKPTGHHVDATPRETIGKINKELELVHNSLLAPWQKIDAMSTFITPKTDFTLRTGAIEKRHLTQTDKLTKRLAISWMNLPQ